MRDPTHWQWRSSSATAPRAQGGGGEWGRVTVHCVCVWLPSLSSSVWSYMKECQNNAHNLVWAPRTSQEIAAEHPGPSLPEPTEPLTVSLPTSDAMGAQVQPRSTMALAEAHLDESSCNTLKRVSPTPAEHQPLQRWRSL